MKKEGENITLRQKNLKRMKILVDRNACVVMMIVYVCERNEENIRSIF